jgi:protein-S-isoprenylcysteine O-methyltransferase Ste14
MAMAIGCAEYFLEARFFPRMKSPAVAWVGVGMAALGEAIRKTAMITAKHNFTHMIQRSRRPEHELITWGIYRCGGEAPIFIHVHICFQSFLRYFLKRASLGLDAPAHLLSSSPTPLCFQTHLPLSCLVPSSVARHPGYAGWLLWSVATQIILCNVVSTGLFAVLAWTFFKSRVMVEDTLLLRFFGDRYRAYYASVGSGLPFIR